ncbi:MAG: HAD family hydrolase [Candidatus Nanohaloarchaea archaeon]
MSKIPVFDIGDTITPSRQLSRKFFRKELKRRGVESPPEYPFEGYNEFVPESIQGWLDEEGIEVEADELVDLYMERKRNRIIESGVLGELKKVQEEISQIGILSDNKKEAKKFYREIFEKRGIEVDGFVVSEEVRARKPSRQIFDAFLDRRDVAGERCVYFGNRGDIDSACQKVGMEFVWVTQYDTFGTSWDGRKIDELTFKEIREVFG